MQLINLISVSVLCAILAIASCEDGAPSYNTENFAEEIAEKPHFIKFYAPWCGHCKRLAPTWDELADKINTDDAELTIAKVDCTVDKRICTENGVTGYPTLILFSNGGTSKEVYRGQRTIEALEDFIKEQMNAATQPDDEEAPKHSFHHLTSKTFASHVKTGFHLVKFYAPWCPHCQRLEPTWEDLAKEIHAEIEGTTIARVDCTEDKDICNQYGVSGYPSLLWFKDGEKVEKYQGDRSMQSLVSYVKEKTIAVDEKGEAEEQKEEEAKPAEKTPGEVLQLTDDTFKSGTANGITFVKFYAPWCGHCKNLAPIWDELAKKFTGNDAATIAKVDCTAESSRPICQKYEVRGFPTLLFFQNGEKIDEYNGRRDLELLYQAVVSKLPKEEL